ncbi:MAG: pantetheine-phosphate adenylyltransferase [Bdellovibrionaceae bacterium]|nr:pantetheine-phosphate adenylyltransferase [Pseudobdellovibrionaceae bacterium]
MKKQDFLHALYPGSFDPITCGHIDIVERFSHIFKKVTLLVASSIHKKYWFSLKEREEMAKATLKHLSNVRVDKYEGLTTSYLKKNNISVVLRGIRSVTDFPYERDLAINNKKIFPEMETLFLFSGMEKEMVSSKWIKEIAFHKGSLEGLVPDYVANKINKQIKEGVKS